MLYFRVLNLIQSRKDSLENGNNKLWSVMRRLGARRRERDQDDQIELGGRKGLCRNFT